MRKGVGPVSLILVMTAGMLMLPATMCEAAPVNVKIHLDLNTPAIWVQDTGKFVGLCRQGPSGPNKHCAGNQISWKLLVNPAGSWDAAKDRVYIYNAPNHPTCFGADPVATFTAHNDVQDSGVPALACAGEKYGTYWPYVVEYWHDGQWKASTDPGGIIFP